MFNGKEKVGCWFCSGRVQRYRVRGSVMSKAISLHLHSPPRVKSVAQQDFLGLECYFQGSRMGRLADF